MRSEAQRQASRNNGAKSKGPQTAEGRERARLNALTHGLRAEQVVLPGEDPAEFDALLEELLDEWSPPTTTRALLVWRLAATAWKLRRATRSDAARRRMTAEGSASAFENARRRRVDRAIDNLDREPTASVWDLESHAAGLDRLLSTAATLEAALAGGPAGWDEPILQARLMVLHGRGLEDSPDLIGAPGTASLRLLTANAPDADPLPPEEAEAAVATIRAAVAGHVERLRALRAEVRDPAAERAEMESAALWDETPETRLRARYEMALERSFRSTIKQLMELSRTGADLPEPAASPESPSPEVEVTPPDPTPAVSATSPPSGSLGAKGSKPTRGGFADPRRGPKPSERAARRARKGRSPS